MSHDVLATLAALEHRYTGPVPEGLRRAARLGSANLADYLLAEGQARFYRDMVLGQVIIIRRRRAEGSFHSGLVEDLRYYRDGWRRWHRRARGLAAAICL